MSSILEKIAKPEDIKNLSDSELEILEKEIRREIIAVVSKNGGHLSSNLGVIELTIALLRQFDFLTDKIVWDVGHQTYAYKILTGRSDKFCTLRKINGLAGFPKRCESDYDCFNTGHSSTSVSAALGILRSNMLKGVNSKVIAVIGDGALTGGMSFEALNDAGQSGLDLLVILNDNQMSINKNVGGLSKHLEGMRVSMKYLGIKRRADKFLSRTGVGRFIKRFLEKLKDLIKHIIRPSRVIFEDLGFKYYGPVDGHDIKDLEMHLKAIRNIKGPVLMHVLTLKGKGYDFAEVSPDKYHGVAPFEIANGLPIETNNQNLKYSSFSDAFAAELIECAKTDNEIVAISAAMTSGTGLDHFRELFPDRFFDVGIAEQHALTMAAGMATGGVKPVVAMYSTFLQRGYDQLLHDIALQQLHVVICVDRAGIVGEDGETHQGIYDLALMTGIPGLTILSPRDYTELGLMLKYSLYKCNGPVAIRYPRGHEREATSIYSLKKDQFTYSEYVPTPIRLKTGSDITMVSEGIMFTQTLKASELLENAGYSCDLIDIRTIKPFNCDAVIDSVNKTGCIIVAENALKINGLGSLVEDFFSRNKILVPVIKIGVHDRPLCQGKIDELMKSEGMDAESIFNVAKNAIEAKRKSQLPNSK